MSKKKWSSEVTENSDALDLEENVFTWKDPKKIAQSLKKSAEKSKRKKTTPYQSAMSMLSFYINRAGNNLDDNQRNVLEKSKGELREAFGRGKED
jgi:putative cell wall-binding protein